MTDENIRNLRHRSTWVARTHSRCPECRRVFDLRQPEQADEFFFGHDCEPKPEERKSK